ncbi:alpha/beta fold hydrolase [Bordetella sp. 15P40C-2]|uniref:alpha/beta fold hydrolase n=1 Tax=Bordetella sp. 15P40C-2 TaxID=2572246 RepID=UPI00132BBA1B|nr:alpha/beta hydrolase [Bordetella sp. 15P40C-2]MVW71679.1 alpha/beta fold hydrolase [Bordetella sp. 15P40C-2]
MPMLKRQNGPDLHYTVTDFTDPWSDRPYLFLQHGYGRRGQFWYQWVPLLARHYNIVCPDMRGQGLSSKDFEIATGFSLETLSDDVIAIADDLGAESFHYCGESIGGLTGLAVAGRYPDRVRTLVNVSGPVFISDGAKKGYSLGEASWPEAVRVLGPRTWLERTNASTRFPPDFSPDFLAWYTDTVEKTGTEVLAALAQFAIEADARPYLPKITAPVLCLYPQKGAIANNEQQDALKSLVRQLDLREVGTTYHMIQHIVPEECVKQVLSHIATYEKNHQ